MSNHHPRRRRPKNPPPTIPPTTSSSSDGDLDPHGASSYESDIPIPSYDGASTDTVYWGWVILCATWLVVVSGVGSVTGAWDWAWGVEDNVKWPESIEAEDQRLPIKGYYPAMIILMGVMAWVWVLSAWVGMKYFKHAKIQG